MQEFFNNDYFVFFLVIVAFIFLYKTLSGNPTALTSKFRLSKIITSSPELLIQKVKKALYDSGFKNIHFNTELNEYRAQTKVSVFSFSEYIKIRIIEKSNMQHVEFFSICALPTQIFDWGKNKRNASKFFNNLILK